MDTCEFCGEKFKMMNVPGLGLIPDDAQGVAEFWNPELGDSQIGHADCAAEAGLEMA